MRMLQVQRRMLMTVAGALLAGAVGCAGPSVWELRYRAQVEENKRLKKQDQSRAEQIIDLYKEVEHLQGKLDAATEALESQQKARAEQEKVREALLSRLRAAVEGTPAEVERRGDTFVITTRFSFKPGKADLDVKARSDLRKIADALREGFSGATYLVAGHADASRILKSDYASNWQLSGERARAVMEFLVNEGKIPPERIGYAGYGEYRPIADNLTPEGREKNRRVEIIINP